MLGRTHEIGGITATMALDVILKGIALNTPTAVACILVSVLGALTPDLDKPTSTIYHLFPAGTFIGKLVHPFFLGGHRHLSHSIIGLVLFGYLSHFLLYKFVTLPDISILYIWIAYMTGFISHLILDAMTDEGIPLFFPTHIKVGIPPIRALRVTTGSWVEHAIVFPLLLIAIGFMYVHFYYIFIK